MSIGRYWAKEAERLRDLEPLQTDPDYPEWQHLHDRAMSNAFQHLEEFKQERATSLAQSGQHPWQRHEAPAEVQ